MSCRSSWSGYGGLSTEILFQLGFYYPLVYLYNRIIFAVYWPLLTSCTWGLMILEYEDSLTNYLLFVSNYKSLNFITLYFIILEFN